MLLDAGLKDLPFLHHTAGKHQVSGFSNDHAGGTGKLLQKNMPDLQCAAHMPRVKQDDLSIPQIWRTLTSNGAVSIGGGDHQNDVCTIQRLRQGIGNLLWCSLTGPFSGHTDCLESLQLLNPCKIVVVQANGVSLVRKKCRHGLAASAGTQNCEAKLLHRKASLF